MILGNLSIKGKLNVIIIMTSIFVVIIAAASTMGYRILTFRQAMIENTATLAQVTSNNSSAALVFGDRDSANEILAALRADSHIITARIYTPDGTTFASYQANSSVGEVVSEPSKFIADGYFFEQGLLHLFKTIHLDSDTIGTIYIQTDLKKLYTDLKFYSLMLIAIVILCIIISYFLSSQFQGIISEPILYIADSMKAVSQEKNYSLRIEKNSSDELGALTDGFNEMLTQIQLRDQKLERQREELEEQVSLRTAELSQTNRELQTAVSDLEKALDEIKILTITDPLTESYNRKYLTEHLPHEIKRAKRYQHCLSLIMCDIDHFKRINDTYGHMAGDQVLTDFVISIMDLIRINVDWVVRYGGEEFLIILPETDLEGAICLGERLRQSIEETAVQTQGVEIHITASFGAVCFDPQNSPDAISPETLINQADEYMYQAKQSGRNTVRGGQLKRVAAQHDKIML